MHQKNSKRKTISKTQKISKHESKQWKDCLLCRLTTIQSDRADIVQWLLTSKESREEKMKVASLLTGLEIDNELLTYLEEPSIARIFAK